MLFKKVFKLFKTSENETFSPRLASESDDLGMLFIAGDHEHFVF